MSLESYLDFKTHLMFKIDQEERDEISRLEQAEAQADTLTRQKKLVEPFFLFLFVLPSTPFINLNTFSCDER